MMKSHQPAEIYRGCMTKRGLIPFIPVAGMRKRVFMTVV
jgi:hypothetical protein